MKKSDFEDLMEVLERLSDKVDEAIRKLDDLKLSEDGVCKYDYDSTEPLPAKVVKHVPSI